MCGRYQVDFEANKELKKVLNQLNQKYPGNQIKKGEVFPTNQAAILVRYQDEVAAEISTWGYPQFTGKGVIINARAETAFEKKTFRESVISRRCVIPTSGFYEWDKEKNKYLFTEKGEDVLYLGGLFQFYNEGNRFVILTTAANESMKEVHHRMPIILKKEQVMPWLMDMEQANILLHVMPPMLSRKKTN